VAAGLVDEYAIYLAPTLLGGPRVALGDIGVETIGDQRRLRIVEVEQLGGDLLLRAVPIPVGAAPVGAVPVSAARVERDGPVHVGGADIFPSTGIPTTDTPTTDAGAPLPAGQEN
jgi:diaminohydroxyphosphoribosylaminopyrimidine deaminase/5-amino-6-(5-phosphoribosylamino)uracil reductase